MGKHKRCPTARKWMLSILAAMVAPLFGGFSGSASSVNAAPNPGKAFPVALATELQAAIDQWAEAPHHRGVSAAVILAEGEEWGHSGGSPFGSSLVFYDPTTGVTIAVLMNQGRGAQHFALAPRLLEIVTTD
jgi:hypothetical protein